MIISIEHESKIHQDAIRRVTEIAFADSEFGHHGEADLIDSIRSATDQCLSLVAIHESEIVGQILFSPVSIRLNKRELPGMGLAPMAVLPEYQRSGIGTQLVTTGLSQLAESNTAFTVVAGHPHYYPKFGFKPSADIGITHGFTGMPQELFFLHTDHPDRLRDFAGGKAYYNPVFGPQHD